ncbi:MAG: hypothetical protein ABSA86_03350 [Oryzomonas sp.]|jgi:hypothetical protein
MKRLVLGMMIAVFAGAITLLPAASRGDSNQAAGANAPLAIGQTLVREGDFAVQLEAALGMGTAGNETEAESRLAEADISPRNGWIADYPMTPDISGEVYSSVRAAADAGKIGLSAESAAERFNNVMAQAGLSATASSVGGGSGAYAVSASSPDEAAIDDYYYNEGPPVITYYSPPPDYSYLYAWVPYPFWCYGFWFPGYFILNDFHRPMFVGGRGVFVSNHFRDIGGHRFARIDAVARFQGRPAMTTSGTGRSGLGVSGGGRGFGGTGSAPQLAPNSRFSAPAYRWGGTNGMPYRGRAFSAPPSAPRSAVTGQRNVYRGGGTGSWGGGRTMAHSGIAGGSFRGGGSTGFHGGGSSGGRGHR